MTLAGVHLPLVQEDAETRELMTATLAAFGARRTALGGLDAFERLRPDVIVCDRADGLFVQSPRPGRDVMSGRRRQARHECYRIDDPRRERGEALADAMRAEIARRALVGQLDAVYDEGPNPVRVGRGPAD